MSVHQFRTKFNADEDAIIRARWADPAVSIRDIATELGVSYDAVERRGKVSLKLGPKAVSVFWTPERVERLKTLWADHALTPGQIARAIHPDATSLSVSGKARRLGLTLPINRQAARAKPKVVVCGNSAVIDKPDGQPARAAVSEAAFAPFPGVEPVPFMELLHNHCKWPVGGDGAQMLCCGAPNVNGRYCEAHGRIAYVPDATRKRVDQRLGVPRARRAA